MRLTKYFRINNSQNETHKNITQKLLTKETDSQKCSTKRMHKMRLTKYFSKMINKMRLTKIFHKMRPTKMIQKMRLTKILLTNYSQNETHKNSTKKDTQNETHKNISQKLLTKETLTKMFHKKNAQNETHKNISQK